MRFLRLVVFIWTLYALALDSDARLPDKCPAGHKVNIKTKSCEWCQPGYYQPEQVRSQSCKSCTKCDEDAGSVIEEHCTLFTNTKCKCLENFVPMESDSSTCKCAKGYEFLQQFKACVKKEKPTTSNKLPHLPTSLTSPKPQEGARTQKPPHSTTTASGSLGSTTTIKAKTKDSHTSSIVLGLIFLMVGLLVLTALICKHTMLPHIKRQTSGSSFRTPVEESGDGSQDSLKPNPEEP